MNNNYCVIMAGGLGSRFWPISKTLYPKQFIDILGTGKTLIQETFDRFAEICPPENILVVTNYIYKDLILEQLKDIKPENILCEPSRRNTAPCIAYASYKILKSNPDANIVVAPSDHIILKPHIFTEKVINALKVTAQSNSLLTLGIKPSRPDTGYGYIQFVNDNGHELDCNVRKVKTFTEKPNLELAESFISSGDFLWNSGIFLWSVKSIIKAFENHLPEINDLFKAGMDKYNTPDEEQLIKDIYTVSRSISIDYGIMEKADNVFVISSDFGWSDLGTWGSLYDIRNKNAEGNAIIGKNVMLYDTKNCIVNVPDNKLVVLQGLNDYIVVESDNTLLVCKKTDEQKIRQFVSDVKIEKGEQYV